MRARRGMIKPKRTYFWACDRCGKEYKTLWHALDHKCKKRGRTRLRTAAKGEGE